jgi:hypothetical protein
MVALLSQNFIATSSKGGSNAPAIAKFMKKKGIQRWIAVSRRESREFREFREPAQRTGPISRI